MERKGIFEKIQLFLGEKLNLQFVKLFPRHSVRFAKNYFNNKPLVIAEIGTFRGENALSMLKELNVKKLYIIDPYESYPEYEKRDLETEEKLPEAYYSARKRLKDYKDKIVFIRKRSDDAVKSIPKCDFIYIDGNHTYKFVKNDIKNYFPKLNKYGILAGHDITNKKFNADIVKAVMEFSHRKKLVPFVSRTDFWIVKGNKKQETVEW